MKRLLIAASLACTTAAFAQPTEVPKPQCEPKPDFPGARLREDATVVRNFRRDLDKYKKCMTDYLEERKASMKAHEVAANAAIEDYNATMKAIADAQNAR